MALRPRLKRHVLDRGVSGAQSAIADAVGFDAGLVKRCQMLRGRGMVG